MYNIFNFGLEKALISVSLFQYTVSDVPVLPTQAIQQEVQLNENQSPGPFFTLASRLDTAPAKLPLRSLMALFQQQEKGLFHWHPCVSNTAQAPGNDRFQLPVTLCPQLSLSAVLSPLSRGPAGLQRGPSYPCQPALAGPVLHLPLHLKVLLAFHCSLVISSLPPSGLSPPGQLLPSFTFVRKTGETDASGRQACDRLSRRMTELPNTCVAIFPNTVEKFLGRGWKRAAICYSSEESFSQQYGSFGVVYLLIVCEITLSCSRELFGKAVAAVTFPHRQTVHLSCFTIGTDSEAMEILLLKHTCFGSHVALPCWASGTWCVFSNMLQLLTAIIGAWTASSLLCGC
ncbi:hypothetical protein Anapl_03810 [Anas platyrhynchos]|uniref:Uncharacterized protein n=1 Tax=Anas platyrhynchos TaxID=8839 RepID=R0KBR3_ANAPL|nr:hypothetical protein Anapl_03810 [Anas platyrhynchos]